MRYLVSALKQNSKEVREKYPNLTAPIRVPVITFEDPKNLRQLTPAELGQVVDEQLAAATDSITEKPLDRYETVVVSFRESFEGSKEVGRLDEVWIPEALRNTEATRAQRRRDDDEVTRSDA